MELLAALQQLKILHLRLRTETLTKRCPAANELEQALAPSLKKSICAFHWTKPCSSCVLADSCPYPEINLSAGEALLPFVIRQEPFRRPVVGWDVLIFGLGWQYAPYLLRAMKALAGTRPEQSFTVQYLRPVATDGTFGYSVVSQFREPNVLIGNQPPLMPIPPQAVFHAGHLKLTDTDLLQSAAARDPAKELLLEVIFKTDTFLPMAANKPESPPSFVLLLRELVKRAVILCNTFGGTTVKLPGARFYTRAARVETVRADLNWTPAGGFSGSLLFRGHWQPYWPLFALGQYIHVGAGAPYGQGWLQLRRLD